MEAKVEDSERKLAEFNARLTVRKNKVRSDFCESWAKLSLTLAMLRSLAKLSWSCAWAEQSLAEAEQILA